MNPAVPSRARAGFTLIELLVASAIMVTLVVVVAKVAVDTLTAYDRVVADLSTQAEARTVLDNMERDFNTAVIRPDGRCWMEIIAPQANAAEASGLKKLPNIPADLQPVIMFFAAPGDRPRWTTTGGVRTAVPGETSAVCYRLGRRSPFDLPGSTFQQIYCFQRTIIDAQNTFNEAIPALTVPTGALSAVTTGTPLTYWYSTSRTYIAPYGTNTSGALIASTAIAANAIDMTKDALNTNGGWTMAEDNFCAQNTVGLSLTLWCASSETAADDKLGGVLVGGARPRNARIIGLPPSALRPVVCYPVIESNTASTTAGDNTNRAAISTAGSGVRCAYFPIMAVTSAATAPGVAATATQDFFNYRARIYSDRIQVDTCANPLPYALRQIEVSVTVLAPAGARELRALQASVGVAAASQNQNFRRIAMIHGRSYTRRMIVFGNGN